MGFEGGMTFTHSHFLQDNALGMGGTSERVRLEGGAKMSLLVQLVVPLLVTSVKAELATRSQSTRLPCNMHEGQEITPTCM